MPTALTSRESEVLALVREHRTNAEIADALFVSVRTVETHVSALLRKLGAADRRELARRPAPPGASSVPTALPRSLTSFVGRIVERDQLTDAVRAHQLVTATGPGGVGKTRLAVEVASVLLPEFDDGVVFVDLVKVTDPHLVGSAIADAVDVSDVSAVPRDEALLTTLADRTCLVVMDNCEHVQDEARIWMERLLRACPRVHVLATSRVRLMLPFERVVRVPGLSQDDRGAGDAATLFVERMVAAGGDMPVEDRELAVIGAICASLDGMALGIELAAARAPALGLDALAGALHERLDLLDIGSRAHERHRSLRAAIDWSYELLGLGERTALHALATFAAPADLAAIESVSGMRRGAVVEAVASLVDWNFATRLAGVTPRYRVLETIRQYASDAAAASGDSERLRTAHLRWCTSRLGQLRAATVTHTGEDATGDAWCDDVDTVLDDARVALAGAVEHDPPAVAAAASVLLADVLFQCGHLGEAQQRYEQAAGLEADSEARAHLLRVAAGAAATRNVGGDTVDLLVAAAELALGDGHRARASRDLAGAAALQFRASGLIRRVIVPAEVDALLARASELADGDPHADAAIAVAAGWRPGAMAGGRGLTEHAIDLAVAVADPLLLDEALDQLMAVEVDAGNLAAAATVADRRLEVLSVVPIDASSSLEHFDALHMACHVKLAIGRIADARRHADALAALPCYREQRHIGLGRRMEVDTVAGRFDAVVADAARFERDWRRAGSPVAGNLAIGAYAAAAVHTMLGDDEGAVRLAAIARALVPAPERVDGPTVLWRPTLDALAALHLDDPERAASLTDDPALRIAGANPNEKLWLPWYAAVWAEASVLTDHPSASEHVDQARGWTLGNEVASAMIDRADALLRRCVTGFDDLAARFLAAACPYQAQRTLALGRRHAEGTRESRGERECPDAEVPVTRRGAHR